jgi:hypothetical protein
MSAVDNYREFTDVPPSHYLPHVTLRRYADAAIMELEWAITQWQAEEDDWVRDRATLEAEAEGIGTELTISKRLNAKWMDERTEAIIRAERAEKALAEARLMPREKS